LVASSPVAVLSFSTAWGYLPCSISRLPWSNARGPCGAQPVKHKSNVSRQRNLMKELKALKVSNKLNELNGLTELHESHGL